MYKKVKICNKEEYLAVMCDDERNFDIRIQENRKNFIVREDNRAIVAIYDKNLNDLNNEHKT